MSPLFKKTALATMVSSVFLLAACGGGSSSASSTAISGTVVAAPVKNSIVRIYKIKDDGSRGDLIATADSETDASGAWRAEIPEGVTGPFFVVASGGVYTDEATDVTVTLGDTDELYGVVLKSDKKELISAITPLTHALANRVMNQDKAAGISADEFVTQIVDDVRMNFGFDPTSKLPADPNNPSVDSDAAQKQYALLLGGLSELGKQARDAG